MGMTWDELRLALMMGRRMGEMMGKKWDELMSVSMTGGTMEGVRGSSWDYWTVGLMVEELEVVLKDMW